MKANGVKTLGYIGFDDAYGDGWLAEMKRSAQTAGIKIVAEEKYNRNDPSVTGQVLKLIAAKPDAILIGAVGHARRHAAEGAGRARLQGQDLPDARRRQSRLPARGGRRRQRHDPADRPDAGVRAAAGQQSGQESRRPSTSRSTRRSTARTRARRSAAMRGTRTCCCDKAMPEALKKAKPGTQGVPRRAARCARERQRGRRSHGVFVMTPQRSQRPRQSRARDDHDRQRQLGAGEVTRQASEAGCAQSPQPAFSVVRRSAHRDGPLDRRAAGAGRHHQRRDLRAARAGAGARLHGHARHLRAVGRVRRLRHADARRRCSSASRRARSGCSSGMALLAGVLEIVGRARARELRAPAARARAAGRVAAAARSRRCVWLARAAAAAARRAGRARRSRSSPRSGRCSIASPTSRSPRRRCSCC